MKRIFFSSIALTVGFAVLLHTFALPVTANAPAGASVSPDTALQRLKQGNQRFVQQRTNTDHESLERVKEVSKGQQPFAIILSCADSRVPPELIFDQGIGDLFVVREAGNNGGAFARASIEYAIEHLGSSLVVVLGHTSCGAVKAALTTPKGASAGSQDLDELVAYLQIGLVGQKQDSVDPGFFAAASANVSASAADLLANSKIIQEQVAKGHVKIAQAVYNLDSGKVSFLADGFQSGSLGAPLGSTSPEQHAAH